MRRFLLMIILLAPTLEGLAQLTRYQAVFEVSDHDFADTITIAWERGQVFVPVEIDGCSYRFLLDTGAGMSSVFKGSRLAALCNEVGSIVSYDGAGRSDTVEVVQLPPLLMGSVSLKGCRATVQQPSSAGAAIDGILGFDLVNGGLSVKIDVPSRQLIITDRWRLFSREAGTISLKYHLNYHVPYINVVPFGRHKERVLFDTGSRQFFSMNKAHFDRAARKQYKAQDIQVEGRSWGCHAMGHHGVEAEGEVAFIQLDSLRLGRYAFCDVHCMTTQGGSHIGAPLLAFGAVMFVPQQHRMYFQPCINEQPCRVGNSQLEIAFVADHLGRPQVGLVWEKGIPFQLGFRYGDVIEQIDHRPVGSLAQLAGWGFQRGREYVFTLLDAQGERREVRWVRLP